MPDFIPSAARRVEQRFTTADKFLDYSFSPDAGMLRMSVHDTYRGTWWTGDFVDYRGLISIQMEVSYTRLDCVKNGRCHVRTWDRSFADRTLSRLCRSFLTHLFGAPAK